LKEKRQERRDQKRLAKYDMQDLKQKVKKVKHILHSKKREFDDRDFKLFIKFLDSQPEAVLKHDAVELVWKYMMFLKTSGYHVLHGDTIFCMPLTRLVKMKDL